MNAPLHASHENVKRAESKFRNLESLVNRYLQSAPYRVRIEHKADRTYIIARLEKDIPGDIAWEAVDTVARLRAALDKAIIELVERNERGTSSVGFPFGGIDRTTGKPNVFPYPRMEKGIKKKLTPEQWAVVEAQRPYPGGNDTLWAINEIANEDKHRKDLVRTEPFLSQDVALQIASGRNVMFLDYLAIGPTDCDFVLADKKREKVLLATGTRSLNAQIEQSLSVSVVFGNVMPVKGKDVLVTLDQQIRLVDGIIKIFRDKFF